MKVVYHHLVVRVILLLVVIVVVLLGININVLDKIQWIVTMFLLEQFAIQVQKLGEEVEELIEEEDNGKAMS